MSWPSTRPAASRLRARSDARSRSLWSRRTTSAPRPRSRARSRSLAIEANADRRAEKRADDLRADKLDLAPTEPALREILGDEDGAHMPRQLRSRRELCEAPSDGGARLARKHRRQQGGRGKQRPDGDQRRTPSIALRLAIRPANSRSAAAGTRTNRPMGCSSLAASDGTVSAR